MFSRLLASELNTAVRIACVLNACLEEMFINPLVSKGRVMCSQTLKPIKTDQSCAMQDSSTSLVSSEHLKCG